MNKIINVSIAFGLGTQLPVLTSLLTENSYPTNMILPRTKLSWKATIALAWEYVRIMFYKLHASDKKKRR